MKALKVGCSRIQARNFSANPDAFKDEHLSYCDFVVHTQGLQQVSLTFFYMDEGNVDEVISYLKKVKKKLQRKAAEGIDK